MARAVGKRNWQTSLASSFFSRLKVLKVPWELSSTVQVMPGGVTDAQHTHWEERKFRKSWAQVSEHSTWAPPTKKSQKHKHPFYGIHDQRGPMVSTICIRLFRHVTRGLNTICQWYTVAVTHVSVCFQFLFKRILSVVKRIILEWSNNRKTIHRRMPWSRHVESYQLLSICFKLCSFTWWIFQRCMSTGKKMDFSSRKLFWPTVWWIVWRRNVSRRVNA